MRIGLIAPPWVPVPPPAYGGTEAVVDRLARGFAAAGHEVLLAATADSRCPVTRVPGLEAADPDRIGEALLELRHTARAYAAMSGVDVIHDHTVTGPLYRHRPVGVPVVVTCHGPFGAAELDLFRVIQRDASIVAISHDQAGTASGVAVAKVIHHGIDVDDIPVGAGGDYACFVGRMDPGKGLHEAIATARTAGVPLRIAAKMREPAEEEYFRARIAPELGPDVEYLGELDTAGTYQLMGGALALLNTIQWPEPFGLVMIESLSVGTPVVATNNGSAPEIVEDGRTGFLRDTRAALAKALLDAAGLDRAECRAAARHRFATDRMVADHLELYTSVTAAARAAGGRTMVRLPAPAPPVRPTQRAGELS